MPGASEACPGGSDVGACRAGTRVCEPQGRWGPCEGAVAARIEICDGQDNDCDGAVDNAAPPAPVELHAGVCAGLFVELVCAPDAGGWVPSLAALCRLAPEGYEALELSCDGLDNDCDGEVDEVLGEPLHAPPCVPLGVCQVARRECDLEHPAHVRCVQVGAVAELCNGLDDDCDGAVDEDLAEVTCGLGACEHNAPTCVEGSPADCDPLLGSSPEVCNGVDDDCNGEVDDVPGRPCSCEPPCAVGSTCLAGRCVPGCTSDADCQPADVACVVAPCPYCRWADGSCEGLGTCALSLEDHEAVQRCEERWEEQPLPRTCGCDGRPYASPCRAERAGVSLADPHRCYPEPPPLGACAQDHDCAGDWTCRHVMDSSDPPCACADPQVACPDCPDDGRCVAGACARPCAMDDDCDAGRSPCATFPVGPPELNGVDACGQGRCEPPRPRPVDPDGTCPVGYAHTREVCLPGCRETADCNPTPCRPGADPGCSYCRQPLGACDALGVCAAPVSDPLVCRDLCGHPEPDLPVVGCDGRPYANACEADAFGVSIAGRP